MQKIYIVEDDKNIAEIEEFALKIQALKFIHFQMPRISIKKWKINIRI